MALPQLNNDNPIYEMEVPSTGETVNFRPFLVREQKNLLIALESQDPKQLLKAMLSCLESCVSNVKVSELSTFDVDYMFTQIRSKSVGETTKVLIKCENCEDESSVDVNLSEIKMDTAEMQDPLIQLTDKISVKMKYPTYVDMMDSTIFNEDMSRVEFIFENVVNSMHSIQTEDENILLKDEPKEEIEKFINNLSNEQLEKITAFVDGMPTLKHVIENKCAKCGHDNELTLQGLQDFF